MPAPPPELTARLVALGPRLAGRATQFGGAVRRLSAEVPAGDLLWLDRLHAAGDLTDHQLELLVEGRDDALRVGPYAIADALGPRTRSAVGPAGLAALKACGERTEYLEHLCRVDLAHPAIVVPRALVEDDSNVWARSTSADGPTLAARVAARGRLSGGETLTLARRLADGLAAAEAAGLIHGEIHAHNVRLSPSGPVLVDCGLAPLLPPRSGDRSRGGWAESTDGPPTFGTDADLRAFACLLWGVLAGRPPFLLAPRRFGTVGAEAPALPPIGELAPETPEVLAEAIDALTGHSPESAPDSFAVLADRLRPHRPPVSPVRTAGWAIACGAALAGIVGAASAPGTAERDVPPDPPPVPAPLRTAVSDEPHPTPALPPSPVVRRVAVPEAGR